MNRAAIIGVVVLLAVIGVLIALLTLGASGSPGPTKPKPHRIYSEDEITVTGLGASQMRKFTLATATPIRIDVENTKDANKGFKVYVMQETYWASFEAGGNFRRLPEFDCASARACHHEGTLMAGSWCVVVQNGENVTDTIVELTVTENP